MAIIYDDRDWHERGDDPAPLVEKLMQLSWELGLDKDITFMASERLYKEVEETHYGALKPAQ